MTRNRVSKLILLLLVSAVSFTSAQATQTTGQKHRTRIGMKRARAIARARVPNGTFTSSELEREKGHMIYSFDISSRSGVTEVNVDAYSGAVLNVHKETAADEANEKREDAKPKKLP